VERAADKAMIEHQSEGGEATLPVKPEPDFPREGITQLPVRYRAPRRLGVIGCDSDYSTDNAGRAKSLPRHMRAGRIPWRVGCGRPDLSRSQSETRYLAGTTIRPTSAGTKAAHFDVDEQQPRLDGVLARQTARVLSVRRGAVSLYFFASDACLLSHFESNAAKSLSAPQIS
jgi:hypothetical protein